MSSTALLLCSISIGLDKGGVPGAAALGMALALAATSGGDDGSRGMGSESAIILASLVPILFSADICAVYVYRNLVNWEIIRLLFPPCIIGIGVGAFLLRVMSEKFIQRSVALALILTAVAHFISKQLVRRKKLLLPVADMDGDAHDKNDKSIESFPVLGSAAFGFIIGVCTMLANISGPILVCYLLKRGLVKSELNATRAWMFVFVNCLKLPLQWYLGNLKLDNIPSLLPMCLLAIGMTWITERFIMPKVNQDLFEKVAWTSVVLSAVKLLM